MDKIERIIDLKQEETFIEEYVSLRNRYGNLLLTAPVTIAETKKWLKEGTTEVRGIAQNCSLVGVAILYLARNGEIAVFAKDQRQGVGTKLLKIIEKAARQKEVHRVWAWVLADNVAAQRTFRKNGYEVEGESSRVYGNESLKGIIFRKEIV